VLTPKFFAQLGHHAEIEDGVLLVRKTEARASSKVLPLLAARDSARGYPTDASSWRAARSVRSESEVEEANFWRRDHEAK